jgi:hypothetical protein
MLAASTQPQLTTQVCDVILSLAFDHIFDLRRCDVDVSSTGRRELLLIAPR